MSGGHFDYVQYRINDIISDIEKLIENNDVEDEWGYKRGFNPDTIQKFRETIQVLERGEAMAQRVDWLVSGDDGEESFHRRWDEELNKLKEKYETE